MAVIMSGPSGINSEKVRYLYLGSTNSAAYYPPSYVFPGDQPGKNQPYTDDRIASNGSTIINNDIFTCSHTGPGKGSFTKTDSYIRVTQNGSTSSTAQRTLLYTTQKIDLTDYTFFLIDAKMDRPDKCAVAALSTSAVVGGVVTKMLGLHTNSDASGYGGVIGIYVGDLIGPHHLGFYYVWSGSDMTCKATIYSMALV